MPDLPSSNPKQFIQGAPVMHVPDVLSTAAFYRDILGFTWNFGDETYSVVWRDNSAIHLVKGADSPNGVHLFQWVQDVDACHEEIVSRGGNVAGPPRNQPYGLREFSMRDNNGIDIIFGQDID